MRNLSSFPSFYAVALYACCVAGLGRAQEVFSDVAGYRDVVIPTGRDVYSSIPITAGDPLVAPIATAGAPDEDGIVAVTLAGVSGFSDDELAGTHGLRVFAGPERGRRFRVVANGATTIGVEFDGNSPSPGTVVALEEFWTIDRLFPPATQSAFAVSSGPFLDQRKSELIILEKQSGSGRAAAARIYYLDGGQWKRSGADYGDAGNDVIPVDAALVIRNPSSSPAGNWSIAGVGYHGPVVTRIHPRVGSQGSAALGMVSTGGQTIDRLGIDEDVVRLSDGSGLGERTDILHVFGQTRPSSPMPTASYVRTAAGWQSLSGGGFADTEIVPSGAVLMIENIQPAPGGRSDWVQKGGD